MTVSTERSHEEYVGNGVTTDFDFRFRIFEGKHLIVVVADDDGNETTLKNGTDYTIVGAGSYHGGKVVLNKPLAQGWKILLERDLPVVQETDLRNQGKFFAEVHEDAFDYLTMLIQKALGTFSLSLRKPTYLSNYYDAKGNCIINLASPRVGGDATNKDYVDNSIKDIDSKTLRVKDKAIPALPPAEQRRNKQLGFDNEGYPQLLDPAETGSLGYVFVDSFEKGAEITTRYQALHWESNGEYYRWDGELPKYVPLNSTPEYSGGIGKGKWLSIGDASLRTDLVNVVSTYHSIKELIYSNRNNRVKVCRVLSYHYGLNKGGGLFIFDEKMPSSYHDGGYYISINKDFPDWSIEKEVIEWFSPANGKNGGWIRVKQGDVHVSQYGAIGDFDGKEGTDDTHSFNAATSGHVKYNESDFSNISFLKKTIVIDDVTHAYLINGSVYIRKGQELRGNGIGPARIFIKADKYNPTSTFILGVGLIKNPFGNLNVEYLSNSENSITLNGSIIVKTYSWLYPERKIWINNKLKVVKSTIEVDGKTKIYLNNIDGISIGDFIDKAEITDSGGLPPSIKNICTEGGHFADNDNNYPVIDGRSAAGMSINTLFITSASLGIWGASGDVNIHSVTIDNGGEGMRLQGSRNSIIGCHFFWNNIAINIKKNAFDWCINGCTFTFSKMQDISINGINSDNILNISFTGCHFIENARYNKTAMIHIISGSANLIFNNCCFNNMWSYVFLQSSDKISDVSFDSCIFNGNKSNNKYIQSTSTKGLRFIDGFYKIKNCEFININDFPVIIYGSKLESFYEIKNNTVINCKSESFIKINSISGFLSVKDNNSKDNNMVLMSGIINYSLIGNLLIYKNNIYKKSGNTIEISSVIGDSFNVCIGFNESISGSVFYYRSYFMNIATGTSNINGKISDYVTTNVLNGSLPGSVPPNSTIEFRFDNGENIRDFNSNKLQRLYITAPSGSSNFHIVV